MSAIVLYPEFEKLVEAAIAGLHEESLATLKSIALDKHEWMSRRVAAVKLMQRRVLWVGDSTQTLTQIEQWCKVQLEQIACEEGELAHVLLSGMSDLLGDTKAAQYDNSIEEANEDYWNNAPIEAYLGIPHR